MVGEKILSFERTIELILELLSWPSNGEGQTCLTTITTNRVEKHASLYLAGKPDAYTVERALKQLLDEKKIAEVKIKGLVFYIRSNYTISINGRDISLFD